MSRKFTNTRSTKALRDYFALAESQQTSATLVLLSPDDDDFPIPGNGVHCGRDTDDDGFPDKSLDCTDRLRYKYFADQCKYTMGQKKSRPQLLAGAYSPAM